MSIRAAAILKESIIHLELTKDAAKRRDISKKLDAFVEASTKRPIRSNSAAGQRIQAEIDAGT